MSEGQEIIGSAERTETANSNLPPLKIFTVVETTVNLIARNWMILFAVVVVTIIVPKIILFGFASISGHTWSDLVMVDGPLRIVATVNELLGGLLLQLLVAYFLLCRVNQEPIILARLTPLIGRGLLLSISSSLGLILGAFLFIPMIIWIVQWAVLMPTFVSDRRSIAQTYESSTQLAQGYFWKIFTIIVIAMGGYVVFLIAMNVVAAFVFVPALGLDFGIFGVWLFMAVGKLFYTVPPVALFLELKRLKGGLATPDIAEIFD
jgi:hypothetical protein